MIVGSPDWRRVVAMLVEDDRRAAFAMAVLGSTRAEVEARLGERRATRALRALAEVALVAEDADGVLSADGAVFHDLLHGSATARATKGPERFLRGGRIAQYPANSSDRRALLELIVDRAIGTNEVLDERGVNERLAEFTDDVALLRRSLVDAALLERTRSGSEYARPAADVPGDARQAGARVIDPATVTGPADSAGARTA
ncbi:hypothetical protein ARHIZOSPH14_14170 [Agromyces rhizosphaerae]|uniref:DUF2087 domain-containing protein n=1 Tax=Agromyces rhizosphaerae TaxID=88374 RepID=A0A9W6CVK6_9MICO|nr:DUF2087 domain-containing protein [Agromyces rhizosphaerae]GLI27175.1 hypothetical protein ARHIZOSPH14_14170 [Agromyces rhizosphaerae]